VLPTADPCAEAGLLGPTHPTPGEVFHPHFPKVLECRLAKELTITLRYQTVTFNKEGAEKMKPGQAWHLAGASFESTGDLVIGGEEVKAGKYALSGRKTEDAGWELVLHPGRGFSTQIGDDAHVLATRVDKNAPLFEHLSIDIQPSGDKKNTTLHLDVRFDTLLATALIEIPE